MDIGGIIQLLGGLGKVGGGIMSAFDKEPLPYGTTEAANAANAANIYANASLDPSSPYFRSLAETEELRGRGDLISSIHEILRQQASRNATGKGTINNERRDETVWGMLTKGFQEAGLRAREMARQKLIDMSGAQRGIAASYGGLGQNSMMIQMLNRGSRNAGMAGTWDAVGALGSKVKQDSDAKSKADASTPDWFKRATGY
jgi:hypothetical protein